MASPIGLGGSVALTAAAAETLIFDSSVDVISAGVRSNAAIFTINNGTGNAFIRNPAVNGTGNYYQMTSGQVKDFIVSRAGGVSQLYAKSDNGTIIIGAPTGTN